MHFVLKYLAFFISYGHLTDSNVLERLQMSPMATRSEPVGVHSFENWSFQVQLLKFLYRKNYAVYFV